MRYEVTAVEWLTGYVQSLCGEAVEQARAIDWSDDERERLAEPLAKLRATLELLELAVSGSVDVDWTGELAELDRWKLA